MTLTVGSLFAGIGGFDLAAERAGMTIKWQVEIDQHCQVVLARHYPHTEVWSDVKEVGQQNLAPVDVVCGGFPCQDLSVAGKRAGLAGERSGLWYEYLRILGELRPGWVVIENVPGLLSSDGGRDFAVILRGLAECGYLTAWRVLDAQYFGVAQRRRRVFIVASLGNGRCADVLFEREGGAGDTPPSREAGEGIAGNVATGINGSGLRGRQPGSAATFVAATLNSGGNSGGFRTEPGEHLVACVNGNSTPEVSYDIAMPLRADDGSGNRQVMEFDNRQGASADKANTLRADCHAAQPCIAFTQNTRDEVRLINGDGAIAGALGAQPGMHQQTYAFDTAQITSNVNRTRVEVGLPASTLNAAGQMHVGGGFGVRRLTPRECERLQGFPDDWTAGQSDSVRYRQLGNAVCVPVVEWIMRRIAGVAHE